MLADITAAQFTDQLINGVTLGMLYILVALGLNIVLGLMGVINFSHGSFFMLGAYLMYQFAGPLGFWAAIALAALLVGLLGMAFEVTLVRRLYGRLPEYALLLTYGTALMFTQAVRAQWGDDAVRVSIPASLATPIVIAGHQFPFYNDVFLVAATIVVLALVWLLVNKTSVGLVIRAGTRDAEMVKALGIDLPLTFTVVFGVGSLLAGLAGALAAPLYAVQPNLASQWIVLTFVIVIVGGIGSFWGAIVGGILIGVLSSFMALLWSPATELTAYMLMGIILLVRPRGLFGVEGLFE